MELPQQACKRSCASISGLVSIVRTFDDAGLDSLFAPGACAFAAGEGLLALAVVAVVLDLLAVDLLAVALGFAAAGLVLALTGAALLTAAVALPTACINTAQRQETPHISHRRTVSIT
jgi:hypothetical protein